MSQFSSHHAQPYSPADYGWGEAWEHAFAHYRAAGLIRPVSCARLRADREATKKDIARKLRSTYEFRERQQ